MLTSSAKTLADKLLPSEKLIIDMKYAMPRIDSMSAIHVSTYAAGLMIRIHAAMGWSMPTDDVTTNALIHEFTQYVSESCGDMTPEEIAYSVRTNGVGVKEWGKNMNLALIDQCVSEYRAERARLSEAERLSSQTQGVAKKEELPSGPVDWSTQWSDAIEWAKNGQIHKLPILAALYDWMDSQGLVTLNPKFPSRPGVTDKQKREIMLHVGGLYVAELEAVILNQNPYIYPLWEVKRRLNLLRTNNRAWKKDYALNATLTNLAKIETVRQLAVMAAKLQSND